MKNNWIKKSTSLLICLSLGWPVHGQPTEFPPIDSSPSFSVSTNDVVPGELIVKFKPGVSSVSQSQSVQSFSSSSQSFESKVLGAKSQQLKILKQMVHVKLKSGINMSQAIDDLQKSGLVEYAEPNYRVHILETTPNDTHFGNMWGLKNTAQFGGTLDADIDATDAWDTRTDCSSVVVAVVDTGVDHGHGDLSSNMWENAAEKNGTPGIDDDGNGFIDDIHGADFFNNDGNPFDDHGHGTHVAGTIGAVGNNSNGTTGVCWEVKLMALKFLDSSGNGTVAKAIEAIQYGIDQGAHVMNHSWGGSDNSQALQNVINSAQANGILSVAAAGNNNNNTLFYPAAHNNVIGVSATTHNDTKWSSSNFGVRVDVSAPGEFVYSTIPGNSYAFFNGTSMASPHVAGLAALLKAENATLTTKQLMQLIQTSVDDLGDPDWDTKFGAGRINAKKAIDMVTNGQTAFPDAEISSPTFKSIVGRSVQIVGTASGAGFSSYSLDYKTKTGTTWTNIVNNITTPVSNGTLANFDASAASNGNYHIRLTVIDTLNRKQYVVTEVEIDSELPTVSITQPSNGNNVEGLVSMSAVASDNKGIEKVEFLINSVFLASDSSSPYSTTWNTAGLNPGSYTITAKAFDNTGNTNTHQISVNIVDNEDPTVNITSPSNNDNITGTINVTATATDNFVVQDVKFYVDGNLIFTDASSPYSFAWNTASVSNGNHTLMARATDTSSNTKDHSINVNVFNDNEDPTIVITNPNDGDTIQGTENVTANATDNVAVSKVEFYVNGILRESDTSAPYSYSFDTTTLANGSHTILARAHDGDGNNASHTISVTINNPDTTPPSVSITNPNNGDDVFGFIEITAVASDNEAMDRVEFYVGGQLQGSDNTSPYSFTWDSKQVNNGTYVIDAKAFDASGNNTTDSVGVTVNNPDVTPPSITILNPQQGDRVGSSISISYQATDNVGIGAVELYINSAKQQFFYPETSYQWNPGGNGPHTIEMKAFDIAGNQSSHVINVFVQLPSAAASLFVNKINPARGETIEIPCTRDVSIYNRLGNLIQTSQCLPSGSATWNGKNFDGSNVSSGVYIYMGDKKGKIVVIK